MGLNNFDSDDGSSSDDKGDASVSYIYVYEPGRSELDGFSNYNTDAYEVTSGGGSVRDYFKKQSQYKNIHEGMSHFLAGMDSVVSNGDFTEVLDFLLEPEDASSDEQVEFYTNALAQWLDTQPEVSDGLISRMRQTEAAQEAQADD